MKRMMSSIVSYMQNDSRKMRMPKPAPLEEMEREMRRALNDAQYDFEQMMKVDPECFPIETAAGRDRLHSFENEKTQLQTFIRTTLQVINDHDHVKRGLNLEDA